MLDTALISRTVGRAGTARGNAYKITVPQNALKVSVDGFRIIPPMGLGSWVAFAPAGNGAMVMGDIVVTETDLKPVQAEVIRQGMTVTAIHNHFVRNEPDVMYMHIGGSGDLARLSASVRAVLDRVTAERGGDPSNASVEDVPNSLDTAALNAVLGHRGEWNGGVYKHTIGRPDVDLREHGVPVTSFMGFNTWASWQGAPQRAAVAGDFAMLEGEVAGVIRALVSHGIEVVAVHNHMVEEAPRIFFLHYWGVGPADSLARGLRAALNETAKGGPSSGSGAH